MNDLPSASTTKDMPNLSHGKVFPSPFLDQANLLLPRTLEDAYQLSMLIFYSNRAFAQAIEWICAYFTGTDIILTSSDEDTDSAYKVYLNEKLNIKDHLFLMARDYKIFGNSCVSVLAPFSRFLTCQSCGRTAPIQEVNWSFKMAKGFSFTCSSCGKRNDSIDPTDKPTQEGDDVVIKRWPIRHMRANAHPFSDKADYYYKVEESLASKIRGGDKKTLEEIPWGLVECVRLDRLFQFNRDMIHHMKAGNLSDSNVDVWGIPPVIASFRDAYLSQILKRDNEILALDHMLPIRMLSPAKQAGAVGGMDTMANVNLGSFGANALRFIERAKKDPSSWLWFPTSVDYTLLNGEGKSFVTPELLEHAQADFLNGLGVPVEMYRKNLSMQAAPMAARLFEAGEVVFQSQLNSSCCWIVDKVSAILNWKAVKAELMKPTHADDLDRRMILLQLMMAGVVSEQDVLSLFGIDWKDTFKRRQNEITHKLQEEKKFQESLHRAEENEMIMSGAAQQAMQMEQQGGGMPMGAPGPDVGAGGMVAPGGGMGGDPTMGVGGPPMSSGVPVDTFMEDAHARAQQIAETTALGSIERKQALMTLKNTDPMLHAVVKAILDQMTAEAEAQGREQLKQPAM